MKHFVIFFLFALLEYFITLTITNKINVINSEYISLKYVSFKFSNSKSLPIGLNNMIKIFTSPIYIILISGILYELDLNYFVKHIYLITLIYYLLKWFIIIVIVERSLIIDWKNEVYCFIISLFLSWFIYLIFISKTTNIFGDIEEIRNKIWLLIATYAITLLVKIFYEYSYLDLKVKNIKTNKYIMKKYNFFKLKYDKIIKTNNKEIKNLVYSIIIYENYNRSKLIRIFEYIKFFITGNASLGIMQIKSSKFITNKDSVKFGYKFIKNHYYSMLKNKNKKDYLKKIVFIYNKSFDYVDEVMYIYNILNTIEKEIDLID